MIRDRASVVAATVIAIILNRLRDPTAREEIIAVLREEFEESARQARNELRSD
jgi:hypothetical protein